jgi:hypothetical protein
MNDLSSRAKAFADKIVSQADVLDRDLIAKVAGVTFDGRQELLSRLTKESAVSLERDRRNPHDFYAIKVLALIDDSWYHVGFLPRKMAKLVSTSLDKGIDFVSFVHRITGGVYSEYKKENLNYGLEVKIKRNN